MKLKCLHFYCLGLVYLRKLTVISLVGFHVMPIMEDTINVRCFLVHSIIRQPENGESECCLFHISQGVEILKKRKMTFLQLMFSGLLAARPLLHEGLII